jgi:ATP-dependent DNA helicase
MPASATTRSKQETAAEMAAEMLKLESEKIEVVPNTEVGKASVLSDEDLEMLLDRSPEVFVDRGQGWCWTGKTKESASGTTDTKGEKKTAFAVYEAPADVGNAALARMFGEDSEC